MRRHCIPTKLRRDVNRELDSQVSSRLHEQVPLSLIFDVLERRGLVALQEDGTPWSGMLLGADGRVQLPLAERRDGEEHRPKPFTNATLLITWYRFETGRYEVSAFVT